MKRYLDLQLPRQKPFGILDQLNLVKPPGSFGSKKKLPDGKFDPTDIACTEKNVLKNHCEF